MTQEQDAFLAPIHVRAKQACGTKPYATATRTLLALVCCLVASPLPAQLKWRRQSPSESPSARGLMAMATHPTTGRPLLMGGSTAPGAEKGDTWEFQGSRWALISTATWPVSREAHAMATDTGRRVVVLFGGDRRATSSGSTAEFRSDTLLFDGRDWTRTAIVGPPARGCHAVGGHALPVAHRHIVPAL